MLKSKKWALLSGLMVGSMILAACTPTTVQVPVTVVQKETSVVKETVESVVTVVAPTDVAAESFTTAHPVLGDVRVRQAIAYCTDRDALIASVYDFIDDKAALRMDTNIPSTHWAHTSPAAQYEFDAAKGGALLDEAGWTLAEGADFRANAAGEELSIKFTTTNAQFRITWASVMEQSLAGCGIRIVRFHVPAAWWFGDTTGVARRDYEIGAFAWVGTADPGGQSLYACDSIPRPENGWAGQNAMGWCNETASVAIKAANNTLDKNERIKQYAIFQEEFAKDMPSLPLFNRAEVLATNAKMEGFKPAPGEAYYNWNAWEWKVEGQDTIVMGFTQEPASLFVLVEDAFVANVAYILIHGKLTTSLNYEYAANIYVEALPTLENGGAVNNDVEVKAGDKVVNSTGDVVALENGVKVYDSTGAVVEFTGAAITMKQMVTTAALKAGLKWSDGSDVVQADIELGDKIRCDKESGATSFIVCDRELDHKYDGLSETYTFVPGYQSPTYMLEGVPDVYPSQQVLSDGRKLGDVPAKEWTTLPEIAETPMGFGPYMITGWEKGQSMTFEANPNFIGGAVATPKLVISFMADTNAAVASLLTGDVDVLGSETLGAGAEVSTVVAASKEGKVAVVIEGSATWEHADFQLYTK